MKDPWAAGPDPLHVSLDWLDDGEWLVRVYTYRHGCDRPVFSRNRTFNGLDAALGWMEAQAFEHGVTTGRPLTYASVLDDVDVPPRSQGRLGL